MSSRWADLWGESRDERALVVFRCGAFACCALLFVYIGGRLAGVGDPLLTVIAVAISIPIGVAMHVAIELFSGTAASALARATGLSGHGVRAGSEHSQLQALVAQGRAREALVGYEAVIAERPDDATVRLHAADVYAREGGDAVRAAALLRDARALLLARRDRRGARWQEGALYATQRLIDLYDGPLGDGGRALGELRRLVDLFPGTREAAAARDALARRKREAHDIAP